MDAKPRSKSPQKSSPKSPQKSSPKSPEKLSPGTIEMRKHAPGLPEEIKARITRTAKGYSHSKAHRISNLEEEIKDAGTRPFTTGEVEYLIRATDEISIFFGHDIYAYMITYVTVIETSIKESRVVGFVKRNTEKVGYHISHHPTNHSDYVPKQKIVTLLTKRLGSGIILPTGPPPEVSIVIPDLNCIFLTLYNRFFRISEVPRKHYNWARDYTRDWILKYARFYTQKILDEMVEEYAPASENDDSKLSKKNRSPSLLMYMISCAERFDISPEIYGDNLQRWTDLLPLKLEGKMFDEDVFEKCKRMYEILSEEISNASVYFPEDNIEW